MALNVLEDMTRRSYDAGYSSPSIGLYEDAHTPKDDDVAKFVMRIFRRAEDYRSQFDSEWDSFLDLYSGVAWGTQNPIRGNEWKAALKINYIYATIESIKAVILDSHPKMDLSARSPEQVPYVDTLQAAVDTVWYRRNGLRKLADAVTNCLIYGNGYLKIWWNPTLENGAGDIDISVVPTENLWVDPDCTFIEDAEYVIEINVVPMSYIKRHYPKYADQVKSDASDPNNYKKKDKPQSQFGYDQVLAYFTPAGDDPKIGDKTHFSNPPWKTGAPRDGYVKLYEVWVQDRTMETVQEWIQTGVDPYTGMAVGEYREVERAKYPHGRVIHYAGGVVLEDEPSPYHAWPYAVIQDNPRPGCFYAMGEPDQLRDLQRELDKARSRLTDHATLMGNAVWIVEKGGVDEETLSNKPGLIVSVERGYQVKRDPPPPLPAWYLQHIEMAIRDIREVSGVSGIPGGIVPRGVRSGAGFQAAQDIGTTRIRLRARNVEDTCVQIGRITISHLQQFYTTPRVIRLTGSGAETFWIPFNHQSMRGDWDITVEPGSTQSGTRAAIAQQAIQLYQLQLIDKRAVLDALRFPGREEILRRMGDPFGRQPTMYPGFPGPPRGGFGDPGLPKDYKGITRNMPQGEVGRSMPVQAGSEGMLSGLPSVGGAPWGVGNPRGSGGVSPDRYYTAAGIPRG